MPIMATKGRSECQLLQNRGETSKPQEAGVTDSSWCSTSMGHSLVGSFFFLPLHKITMNLTVNDVLHVMKFPHIPKAAITCSCALELTAPSRMQGTGATRKEEALQKGQISCPRCWAAAKSEHRIDLGLKQRQPLMYNVE